MPANLLDLTLHEAIRRALPPAEREDQRWKVGLVLDMLEAPAAMRDAAAVAPSAAAGSAWR